VAERTSSEVGMVSPYVEKVTVAVSVVIKLPPTNVITSGFSSRRELLENAPKTLGCGLRKNQKLARLKECEFLVLLECVTYMGLRAI
jgi:hypothetical protein